MASNTTIPYWKSPEYNGRFFLDLNASLIAVTTAVIAMRLYSRGFMTKSLGLDDALAFVAFAMVTTQGSLSLLTLKFGTGAHIQYLPTQLLPKFYSTMVTITMLYFLNTGFTRLSICAFLFRLAKNLRSSFFRRTVYVVACLTACQMIGCTAYLLASCRHVNQVWKLPEPGDHCKPAGEVQVDMELHTCVTIFVDVALFVLPIWVINAKMMKSSKKYKVMLVFSVGLLAVIAAIVRLIYICTYDFYADPTYEVTAKIGIWTSLEGHASLWVASLPSLQPLLRLVSSKLHARSILGIHDSGRRRNLALRPGDNKLAGPGSDGVDGTEGKEVYTQSGGGVDADDNSTGNIISGDRSDTERDNFSMTSDRQGQIHMEIAYDVRVENVEVGRPVLVQNESWVDA